MGVGVAFFLLGQGGAVAALYGGAVATINTLMLGRRVHHSDQLVASTDNARDAMTLLYISAAVRFVFILAAIAAGVKILRLLPVPLVVNFVGVQLAFVLTGVTIGWAVHRRQDKTAMRCGYKGTTRQ